MPTSCAARCLPIDMTKQELRAALKQKRAAFPTEEKKALDRAIIDRIAATDAYRNSKTLLLYAPHGSEINLLPLARLARKDGKTIAFPRCDTETNTMQFYILEPDARLIEGTYGIHEPPENAPLCPPDKTALCVLPGLTFDTAGGRLGYGKGYYDRFLADFTGVTLGAVYASLVVKQVPTEAHDRPVDLLVTEHGVHKCVPISEKPQTPKSNDPLQKLKAYVDAWRQKKRPTADTADVIPAEQAEAEPAPQKVRALHAPPILVATTFALLLLSRLIDTYLTDRNNEYAVVILLQILIFLIPAVLYGKLRGDAFPTRIRMRAPRPDHIWFTVCMLAVMTSGGLLCEILTGGISSLTGNFTLYSTFVARINGSALETVYVILAYGILPAFCEEMIFRSILCAEYERFGVGVSVTASALFFAMLHFSFPHLLTYLLLGALLAGAMYTTRSFLTAFVLHLGYNLFCLFGQPYLSAFYINAGSNEIFVFCLVTVFLLFAAFVTGEARKIYHRYARSNLDSSYTASYPLRTLPKTLLQALLSPATAICLVIWLVMAIMDIV